MLAPQAVDIHSWNLFHYVSHLPNHSTTFFSSSSQVVHWSAEIQTKVYDPKEGRKEWVTDWSTKRVNSCSLTYSNSYFAFYKIVVKKDMVTQWIKINNTKNNALKILKQKGFLFFQFFPIEKSTNGPFCPIFKSHLGGSNSITKTIKQHLSLKGFLQVETVCVRNQCLVNNNTIQQLHTLQAESPLTFLICLGRLKNTLLAR